MAIGSMNAIEKRVAKLKKPYTEAWESVRGSPVIHADETPWYENRSLAWMWVMATDKLTVYQIQGRRNGLH